MRYKIVEVRKDEKRESVFLLTLECGHVIESYYTHSPIGYFENCEKCKKEKT